MNDKIKAKIDFLKLLFSFSMVAFFGIDRMALGGV